jgi:hypothetical protein
MWNRWFTNLSDTKSAANTHEGLSRVLFVIKPYSDCNVSQHFTTTSSHTNMKITGAVFLTISLIMFFALRPAIDATLKELNDDFNGLNFKSYEPNKTYLFEGEISRESKVVGEFFRSQSGPTQTFLYKFRHAPDLAILSEDDIGDKGESVKFWGRTLEGMVGVTNLYRTPKILYLFGGIGASLLILGFIRSRMNDTRSLQKSQPENQDNTE